MAAATAAAAAAAAQKAAEEAAARAAAAVEEAKEALVASVVLPGEEEFDCTADLFIGVFLQAVGKADRDMLQELAAQHVRAAATLYIGWSQDSAMLVHLIDSAVHAENHSTEPCRRSRGHGGRGSAHREGGVAWPAGLGRLQRWECA